MAKKRWRCTFDPDFESAKKRQASGRGAYDKDQEKTETGFEMLLDDEQWNDDIRALFKLKYETG